MSVIEQDKDYIRKWTEQERLEWIKAYQGIVVETPNSWVPEYAIDYTKKCCDNCMYFDEGCCVMDVSNVYTEILIINSDTFYCSYHKFKV